MNLLHDKALLLSRRFLGLGPQQRRAFLDKLREQGLDASAPVSYTHLDVYKRQCARHG